MAKKKNKSATKNSNVQKHARLNCISHLLSMIPYEDISADQVKLTPRKKGKADKIPSLAFVKVVPQIYPK